MIEKDKDAADLMNKYGYLMGDVDKQSERIEQWWIDDDIDLYGENEIEINTQGKILLNEEPGLGTKLDEDWIDFHKIDTVFLIYHDSLKSCYYI